MWLHVQWQHLKSQLIVLGGVASSSWSQLLCYTAWVGLQLVICALSKSLLQAAASFGLTHASL